MTTHYVKTYKVNGVTVFTKGEAMKILRVKHYRTFNQYLSHLDIKARRIGWKEIKEVLGLRLFLDAHRGYHSLYMFKNLTQKKCLDKIFKHFSIDLDKEFKSLKSNYTDDLVD